MIPDYHGYVFPPSNSLSAIDSYYFNIVRNETDWGNQPREKYGYKREKDTVSPSNHKFSVDKVQTVLKKLSETQRLEKIRDMNVKGQDYQPDIYSNDTVQKFQYHKIYSGNTWPVLGLYMSTFN